ncbi:MAG: hypothetical protein U0414_29185 [Polyangiaceae bacterium]
MTRPDGANVTVTCATPLGSPGCLQPAAAPARPASAALAAPALKSPAGAAEAVVLGVGAGVAVGVVEVVVAVVVVVVVVFGDGGKGSVGRVPVVIGPVLGLGSADRTATSSVPAGEGSRGAGPRSVAAGVEGAFVFCGSAVVLLCAVGSLDERDAR